MEPARSASTPDQWSGPEMAGEVSQRDRYASEFEYSFKGHRNDDRCDGREGRGRRCGVRRLNAWGRKPRIRRLSMQVWGVRETIARDGFARMQFSLPWRFSDKVIV